MENLTPQEAPDVIIFDDSCFRQLNVTRKWTKFLSIVGFVFLTFMAIAAGLLLIQFFAFKTSGFPIVALLPVIIMGVLYFFPIYFLSRFSIDSKRALDSSSSKYLAEALRYLKLHYTFVGVLVIVVLAFYLVVIVASLTSSGINFLNF